MTVNEWEKKSEFPLALLAVAFLVAWAWPILDSRMDGTFRESLDLATWTIWAAFLIDLLIRLWLADNRVSYALHHWYDVALVVLPMLRPLRLLRLIALLRILDRSATTSLVGRTAVYLAAAASAAIGIGSLAVLDAERGAPGATITTFGDALWWACETVTTVGYGDRSPVTFEGRCIAVLLMLVGIGLIGTVTATVAATILSRVRGPADDPPAQRPRRVSHDSMDAVARPDDYVYCTIDPRDPVPPRAAATVTEEEGLTVVLPRADADGLGLPYDFVAAWITLRVNSSLDAVGLTASFSRALAHAGISCNVLAGAYHDHLLVPAAERDRALDVLRSLGSRSS